MTFHLHHTVQPDADTLRMLADIQARLKTIQETVTKMATTIQQAIADLKSQVERETTINASAVTAFQGLGQQIQTLSDQLKAAQQSGGDVAAIADQLEQLAGTVSNNADSLAAAITTGTPAAAGTPTPQPTA